MSHVIYVSETLNKIIYQITWVLDATFSFSNLLSSMSFKSVRNLQQAQMILKYEMSFYWNAPQTTQNLILLELIIPHSNQA